MVVVLLHRGDELALEEVEQAVEVDVVVLSGFFSERDGDFRGEVPGAAGHAEESAVEDVDVVVHRRDGVGRGHAEVVVAVEADGDGDVLFKRADVLSGLVGKHAARRVHYRHFVHAVRLKVGAFLGKVRRAQKVRLHQRVAAFQIFRLDRVDDLVVL